MTSLWKPVAAAVAIVGLLSLIRGIGAQLRQDQQAIGEQTVALSHFEAWAKERAAVDAANQARLADLTQAVQSGVTAMREAGQPLRDAASKIALAPPEPDQCEDARVALAETVRALHAARSISTPQPAAGAPETKGLPDDTE